ncbi:MAG TPA: ATP-binding cassette domain-containing protein [Mycobacteriales bacterium]|jgi:ABC-2 type transport system ATP-binding protein|nr:ATP-binding cassette domain-containing protein [Mycobacteriales bacterium]
METIEINNVTKRYGDTIAVDQLSFAVQPGRVTGFLGPNGAGKSTTMRLVLGLDRPDSGNTRIAGRPYADIEEPMRVVGALLEARALHPGRSARRHLQYLAQTQGIGMRRVDEVLDLVGLSDVADKRVGGFSLGMGQRLGIAVALLGDPAILILDEPVNGLDVDGVRWIRELLRSLADEGRTVLLSSHLLNEMAMTADHLVVIRRGRLIADSPTGAFLDRSSQQSVAVESPDMVRLATLVESAGGRVELLSEQAGTITELATAVVGELAAQHGLTLHELATRRPSLEDAFVELTHDTSDLDTSDLIGSTS